MQAAGIAEGCKRTAAWCLGQLPALYGKFCQTCESRYGDEINRLAQGAVKELVATEPVCREAQQLAAKVAKTLQRLHEQFGLPQLNFKPIDVPPTRPRKVG